jgi:hypothetical protein
MAKMSPRERLIFHLSLCGAAFPLVLLTRSVELWKTLAYSALIATGIFVLRLICSGIEIVLRNFTDDSITFPDDQDQDLTSL